MIYKFHQIVNNKYNLDKEFYFMQTNKFYEVL